MASEYYFKLFNGATRLKWICEGIDKAVGLVLLRLLLFLLLLFVFCSCFPLLSVLRIALTMSLTEQQTTLSRGSGPGSPEEPSTGPRSGMPSTDNEHSLNNQSQGHDLTANNSNVNTNTNAHHKSGHNTLANEPVALTEEDRQKEDATGTNPDFSLAGPYNNPQNVYISPEYLETNPGYGKPHDEPLWSLAQPFPRVARPGMRMRGEKGEEVVATQTVRLSYRWE